MTSELQMTSELSYPADEGESPEETKNLAEHLCLTDPAKLHQIPQGPPMVFGRDFHRIGDS